MACIAVLLFSCGRLLTAQVIELSGGSSTLYQSQGGTIRIRGTSYHAQASAGIIAGKPVAGAALTKTYEHAKLTLGTADIPFNLPTDVFDADHYLTAIGAGLDVGSDKPNLGLTHLYTFGGMSSQSLNSPFFEGTRAQQPLMAIFLDHRSTHDISFSSKTLLAPQLTSIQSLQWGPRKGTQLAGSAGFGTNQPYAAASVSINRPWFDLKAAYIDASSQFRRVDVKVPLTAEPDRANLMLTLTPSRHFSFTAGHQNYLMPVYGSTSSVASSVDQFAANAEVSGTSLSATVLRSTSAGSGDEALALFASRDFTPRFRAQASYLASRPQEGARINSFGASIEETLSPRWSISEIVNTSNGQTTVGLGGSVLSNLCTVTASYQTYFLPQRPTNPFEQAIILNAEIHPYGSVTFTAATFVAPDGRLLYTAGAQGLLFHNSAAVAPADRNSMGVMVLRGKVLDRSGQPIEGAALWIDQTPLYTDSTGSFLLRERQARRHALLVLTNQFLDGAAYHVLAAPAEIRSGRAESEPEIVILVERVTRQR